jgi:predicted Zn-dependent protease
MGTEAESIEAEHAVGRDLARALLQQMTADTDPAVCQLLDSLRARLVPCLRRPLWCFQFLAVHAAEVNAFALPGGYVFVTRSLLELCEGSHDELAFVLGHEMGHVVHRHAIDRMMTDSFLRGVLGRLPVGGGLVRAQVGALLTTLVQRGYSRQQELEADAAGLDLARAAGFDPDGGRRVLLRLSAGHAAEPMLFGYFSAHPPLDVRLGHLERRGRSGANE